MILLLSVTRALSGLARSAVAFRNAGQLKRAKEGWKNKTHGGLSVLIACSLRGYL